MRVCVTSKLWDPSSGRSHHPLRNQSKNTHQPIRWVWNTLGKKGELHCMQVRERESCDLRSTNQIMGLPCSSPTAGAVTSDTSDMRLTGRYHGDHKYESVRHLNFQLPDWNHVESTTITTRETVRQTEVSIVKGESIAQSGLVVLSLSLSFSLSLARSHHTAHMLFC